MKAYKSGNDDEHQRNLTMLDETALDEILMKNKLLKLMSPDTNEVHSEE